MSKGKIAFLFVLIGLATINGFFALINFTSLGVPWRYEEAAPTDKQMHGVCLPASLFTFENGWRACGTNGTGSSTQVGDQKQKNYSGFCSYQAIDSSKVDAMNTLLDVVRGLQQQARNIGMALAHSSLHCETFGDKGQYGPKVHWDITHKSVDGRGRGSSGLAFPGTLRFACISLDFVAPKDPSVRSRWTILCDRKEKSFVLMWDLVSLSPIYLGSNSPTVGHYLTITAREDTEDTTQPASIDESQTPVSP